MFASNFDRLVPFVVGGPILILLLALVSLIPAALGYRAALFLSIPCVLAGSFYAYLLFVSGASDGLIGTLWAAPFLTGFFSIILWLVRRGRKN